MRGADPPACHAEWVSGPGLRLSRPGAHVVLSPWPRIEVLEEAGSDGRAWIDAAFDQALTLPDVESAACLLPCLSPEMRWVAPVPVPVRRLVSRFHRNHATLLRLAATGWRGQALLRRYPGLALSIARVRIDGHALQRLVALPIAAMIEATGWPRAVRPTVLAMTARETDVAALDTLFQQGLEAEPEDVSWPDCL